ncbi:MAG: DNA polymerase III subunit gamma/tau, partial [Verrucomicrobia bacterium]|nr:DNA polymerase III subunit gamma/tau [Verrucomicrobiota bacterium]
KDLGRLLGDLLNHFRNLLIFNVSRGDTSLLEVSETELAALKEQSPLADAGALARILETLAEGELKLRDTASRKILLEVTLLKAIEARKATPIDAVLSQLNRLREGGPASGGDAGQSPAPSPARPPATAPAQRTQAAPASAKPEPSQTERPMPSPAAAVEPPSIALAKLWSDLVEAVGRVSPFTRSYLTDGHPVSFDKKLLVIGFDPEFEDHLSLVDNARNHGLLQTKLAELGHPDCQLKFIKAEAPAGWAKMLGASGKPSGKTAPVSNGGTAGGTIAAAAGAKKPAPFDKNDFKNDPLIQKALEMFKGQIVEVRA